MIIKSEAELLNSDTRAAIIEEIEGTENQRRKHDAYKRQLCYKDQTDRFVRDQLLNAFDYQTVVEMAYAIPNISIVRKVVDKLARVYSGSVIRTAESPDQTETVQSVAKVLNLNSALKSTNRLLKLHRNAALYLKPTPYLEYGGLASSQMTICPEPLPPYLYDAIEYAYNRTRPMGFILSNYAPQNLSYSVTDAAVAGRGVTPPVQPSKGDGVDQRIADLKEDEGKPKKQYIWWSGSYHFTTDEKGIVISDPQEMEHDIGRIPIIDMAIGRDGSFWAEGGKDLIDGAILVNSMMAQIHHIGVTQGYGQFYMKGKSLPTNLKIGPTKAIRLEYGEGDPVPDLGFVSANPQIDSLSNLAQAQIALILSTNNLSTSGVQASLSGSQSSASGVAMMIDKAESREDTSDQEQLFIEAENQMFKVIAAELDVFGFDASDDLKKAGTLNKDVEVMTQFIQGGAIMTESEKLDNLKKRSDLGIETMVGLLMKDDQSLTEEMANQKLEMIKAEKSRSMPPLPNSPVEPKAEELLEDEDADAQE